MMKDQDLIEFHDFKQSNLLKMLRLYQETYKDCDGDRIVVEAHGVRIQKSEFDSLLGDSNYSLSIPMMVMYLNYVIRYNEVTKRIPPFFVILTSEDYNPFFGKVVLYSGDLIKQINLAKFKYDGNKNNAPIVILMQCKSKWNMIILELQPWIIDFKCDKETNFETITSFATQFIQDTFGIQIKSFNDFMLDYEQPGDSGDLICDAIYKIFVLNLDLMGDSLLTKQDVTMAKRKLIWLALSHMRERTKVDDEAEFVRRVIAKEREKMLKKLEEEEQQKKEAKLHLQEKKIQVYGFINHEPPKKEEITTQETIEQIILKKKLAQFNATRPRNKVESYLTRLRAKEEFQFIYPEPQIYQPPLKDPRAKVKNFVYEVQLPKGNPEVQQLITPASYCVAEIFNDGMVPTQSQPQLQRVYDYEMLEQNQRREREFENSLKSKPVAQGFFGQIGSHLFDNSDYSIGHEWKGVTKAQPLVQQKAKRIKDQNIEELEDQLFRNV